ncbi:MAG: 50S ribosomal protein L15 [Candidatus Omnitrophica bacterium]|nr:50S ribosomal protein L15 [Candidatus Omnitrophota bacterium]MCF7893510.1 50S ribosomal protein L15 [Candidatus Omnitrophota bacterium]
MDLSDIKIVTKNKKAKRRGRGTGSGLGKTSGRGHKGAGQRKGKKTPYIGFSGGNIPFFRQLPKRGFTARNAKKYQIVNLVTIDQRAKGNTELNPEIMEKLNLIKDKNKLVKVLANKGDKFSLKITIKADKISKKAKEIIESNGGVFECLKR